MGNSYEINARRFESMRLKGNANEDMIQEFSEIASYCDEEILEYLEQNNDKECENIFEEIKSLNKQLEEKSYNFNLMNGLIYVQQIITDIMELYGRAFKLMIENLKPKSNNKENENSKNKAPTNEKEYKKSFEKGKESEGFQKGPEVEKQQWAEISSSQLNKSSTTKKYSNNLKTAPSSMSQQIVQKEKSAEKIFEKGKEMSL